MNNSLAKNFRKIFGSVIAMILILNIFPLSAAKAAPPADKFVRTAAPFMKIVQQSDYDDLS